MKKQVDNSWKKQVGCAYIIIIAFLAMVVIGVVGCSPKIIEHTNIVYRDSLRIEERIKDTTIYVQIPLEKDQAIVHVGDSSYLETSLALSKAFIGENGFLYHYLQNKNERISVTIPIHSKDIFYGVTSEKAKYITKKEYVEKPLSWWKSFKIGAFWWLVAGVGVLLVVVFRKIFKIL